MPRFVAVDGESITIRHDDGTQDHKYVMMGSSEGGYIQNPDGLSTIDCLSWLFNLKSDSPRRAVFVGFAFGYDVNMILRDVGKGKLVELWKEGSVWWRGYRIEWVPTKWFRVKRGNKNVTVCDTFGFFQTSFAKALTGWHVPIPDGMEDMKDARSTFTEMDMPEMLGYCLGECRALVQLMDQLHESLDSVGLTVTNWIGAGAVAASLHQREGVHQHVVPDEEYPAKRHDAILRGYFGGRTELFQQGSFANLFGYDIRSAYPWAMQSLPSLVGGRWQYRRGGKLPISITSICRVHWDLDPDRITMPFPVRHKGAISYPSDGTGWYWRPEVQQAIQAFGDGIQILESYEYIPGDTTSPFDFIPAIYQERAELKRQGHMGQKSLKLAINALYGKLAQGTGFNGAAPKYRSYVWAGVITSMTRAKMFELAQLDPTAVVMICTDGIYFTRPQPVEERDELGGIEAGLITDTFVAQAGIYEGMSNGSELLRSRGVFAKEVNFANIRRGYEQQGPHYVSRMPSTRFVGLGSCIVRRSFEQWRTWQDSERVISLAPGRKFIEDDSARPTRHLPPTGPGVMSAPYVKKTSGLDSKHVEWIQLLEQPLKDTM